MFRQHPGVSARSGRALSAQVRSAWAHSAQARSGQGLVQLTSSKRAPKQRIEFDANSSSYLSSWFASCSCFIAGSPAQDRHDSPDAIGGACGIISKPLRGFLPPLTQLPRAGTDSGSIPPPTEPPERGNEFGRQCKCMTGSLVFLHVGLVPYGSPIGFRDAASPAMADGASSLDKRKAMAGEPIGLLGVALTSRTLQCLDSSAAQCCGLVFFPFRVEFGHNRRPRDAGDIGKQMQRRVIGADCGRDVRSLRK